MKKIVGIRAAAVLAGICLVTSVGSQAYATKVNYTYENKSKEELMKIYDNKVYGLADMRLLEDMKNGTYVAPDKTLSSWAVESKTYLTDRQVYTKPEDYVKPATRGEFSKLVFDTMTRGIFYLEQTGPTMLDRVKEVSKISGNQGIPRDIQALNNLGIIKGDGKNLKENDNITRQEVATILVRVMKYLNMNVDTTEKVKFNDPIEDWAKEGVNAAVNMGLMKGKGSGIFDAKANVTYEESMVIAKRLFEVKFEKEMKDSIIVKQYGPLQFPTWEKIQQINSKTNESWKNDVPEVYGNDRYVNNEDEYFSLYAKNRDFDWSHGSGLDLNNPLNANLIAKIKEPLKTPSWAKPSYKQDEILKNTVDEILSGKVNMRALSTKLPAIDYGYRIADIYPNLGFVSQAPLMTRVYIGSNLNKTYKLPSPAYLEKLIADNTIQFTPRYIHDAPPADFVGKIAPDQGSVDVKVKKNLDITFNGKSIAFTGVDGQQKYPLEFNGRIYVPVKGFCDFTGVTYEKLIVHDANASAIQILSSEAVSYRLVETWAVRGDIKVKTPKIETSTLQKGTDEIVKVKIKGGSVAITAGLVTPEQDALLWKNKRDHLIKGLLMPTEIGVPDAKLVVGDTEYAPISALAWTFSLYADTTKEGVIDLKDIAFEPRIKGAMPAMISKFNHGTGQYVKSELIEGMALRATEKKENKFEFIKGTEADIMQLQGIRNNITVYNFNVIGFESLRFIKTDDKSDISIRDKFLMDRAGDKDVRYEK